MEKTIEIGLVKKSRIQEGSELKTGYINRIIEEFLNADNLTGLQKAQVESIRYFIGRFLSKAA